MTEREFNELRETGWRRPVSAAEEARAQAYLALHPQAQEAWEQEDGLNRLLDQLPAAPLSSNFTAQVLQNLDHQDAIPSRHSFLRKWFRQWLRNPLPRLAWSAAVIALALLGYQRHQVYQNEILAKNLVQFAASNGLKEPSIFQDFEVIQHLGQIPPPADEELWLALSSVSSR